MKNKSDILPRDFHKIEFTKHECVVFIEKGIQVGTFKKCAHIISHKYGSSIFSAYYKPRCLEDSFNIEKKYSLTLLYGCPRNCRRYKPLWRGKLSNFAKVISDYYHRVELRIKNIVKIFSSLPAITQIIIILAILFAFNASRLITIVLRLSQCVSIN